MSGRNAIKNADIWEAQCLPCSTCGALITVQTPRAGASLLEIGCVHCGIADIYHTNLLRPALRRGDDTKHAAAGTGSRPFR